MHTEIFITELKICFKHWLFQVKIRMTWLEHIAMYFQHQLPLYIIDTEVEFETTRIKHFVYYILHNYILCTF